MHHHSNRLGIPPTLLPIALVLFVVLQARAQSGPETPSFRTDQRVRWTESHVQGSPEPPDPYRLAVAFPGLTFDSPVDLVPVPGADRLAVVEHRKGISTFKVDGNTSRADMMLKTDELGVLFAAAFHPQFLENGWAYFTHNDGAAMRLARVHCSMSSGVPIADPASREVIFTWPNTGHTGGCIRFGPDGFLYLGAGDGSDHSDTNQYAQDINDPRGSMLRLDVNHPDGNQLYRAPADNPFVNRAQAAPEVFAYGLRQPWKFSFDADGRLWAGDVGQDLWEMIYLIQKGANYGWSINEGTHPFRPERKQGPTPIVPPIVEHHHTEFRSITGGHVYQSSRLDELRGAYIYGDFDTGRVWMLRYAGEKVVDHRQLTGSQVRVVGFGQDQEGEVYVVGYASGRIYRLERAPVVQGEQPEFPRKLSETGLFSSTREHVLAPGVVPYSLNSPVFADGAAVQRFLGLPGDGQIEFDALLYPRAPGAPPGWRFPDGTVLAQTFIMPQAAGGRPRRVETRIIHHQRMPGADDEYGAQIWRGYSYVWNDDQTDAELADAGGMERQLTLVDPASGKERRQTWRIPSRNECIACHNIASKHAIGVNTMQMNRQHDYGDVVDNQLAVFERLGLFAQSLPDAPRQLPRLADYSDHAASLDDRARAYLHANCSHCHRQWGGGNSSFQLMATIPLNEMKIVDAKPAHGAFGIEGAQLVAPGNPYQSMVLYRMLSLGAARMPRLGSSTIDSSGARLIHDWIANMPRASAAQASVLMDLPAQLLRSTHDDAYRSLLDAWLSDTSRAMRLVHAIDSREVDDSAGEMMIERAATSDDALVRDLFDRYLPEERRLKRLGNDINPEVILSMDANANKGELLFFNSTTLQCKNCHQINGRGTKLGPELSQIGKQYDPYRLLDSIVNPSREVKPEYQVVVVQTADGQALSGIRVPNTGEDVVLKDANNKEIRVPADKVEHIAPQTTSLMPDAQIRSLTAQQLADLVAYLSSLK